MATFAPVNPVAYLEVGGEPQVLDALERLRSSCLQGPLDRPTEHEFVPHVTVAEELAGDRLDAVTKLLTDFVIETTIDRVHVLAELPGRVWKPVADAPLGERPGVVGRGSLPLELTTTGRPDVEAAALLSFEEATRRSAVRGDGAIQRRGGGSGVGMVGTGCPRAGRPRHRRRAPWPRVRSPPPGGRGGARPAPRVRARRARCAPWWRRWRAPGRRRLPAPRRPRRRGSPLGAPPRAGDGRGASS